MESSELGTTGAHSDCASQENVPTISMYDNMLKICTENRAERSEILKNTVSRVINNDDEIRALLSQAVRAEAAKKTSALLSKSRPVIRLSDKVSTEQEMILSEEFSEFELNFDRATERGDHPFYRCYRRLSEKRIDRSFVHKFRQQDKRYDVLIKDVGGNPITHLNSEYDEHTCMPILDDNDALRHARYLKRLRSYIPANERSRFLLNKHIKQEKTYICHRRSQNCSVKAPYLKFLHSSYDISVENICRSMYRANAVEGKGVFLFNVKILNDESGELGHGLNFVKFKNDSGEMKVRYYFDDDMQAAYTHDLVNIYKLMKTFRYELRIGNKTYVYLFSFRKGLANHIEFDVYRHEFGNIPANNMCRVLKESGIEESVVVYWYRWETLHNGDSMFDFIKNHMVPIRLVVPRKLWADLLAYANTLGDKLTVLNIMIAANAMNTREVINGQSVGISVKVDPDTLKHLANCIWFITFITNYECSKVIQVLREDEERVRRLSRKYVHKRFFSRVVQRILKNHRSDFDSFDPKHVECPSTLKMKGLLDNMRSNGSVIRNYDFCVNDRLCNVMTLEEEMDMLVHDVDLLGSTYDESYIEDELLKKKELRNNLLLSISEERSATVYNKNLCEREVCFETLTEIRNVNEGDCFYQAMRDINITSESTEIIRSRLLKSIYLNKFETKADLIERFVARIGTKEAFANIEVAMLVALEYDVGLCIHTPTSHLQFNMNSERETYHFRFNRNHCTALKIRQSVEDVLELYSGKESPDYDRESLRKQLENFHSINKNADKLKRAKANAYYIERLGKCGYNNRAGLKTAEMFNRYFGKYEINTAVTLGGPGAEAEFLIERLGCRVYGMTLVDGSKSGFDIKDYGAFTQIYGDRGNGDILDIKNVASAVEEILEINGERVDFCGCDIATCDDNKDVDTKLNARMFLNEVKMVAAVLKEGGNAYFKVFSLVEDEAVAAQNYLHDSFRDVKYVKLETSRPWSTERHIICTHFRYVKEDVVKLCEGMYETEPKGKYLWLQKEFENYVRRSLNILQRCINTVDTKNPIRNEISDARVRYYTNLYGISNDYEDVGVFDKVKKNVRYFFNPSRRLIDTLELANEVLTRDIVVVNHEDDCEVESEQDNFSIDSLEVDSTDTDFVSACSNPSISTNDLYSITTNSSLDWDYESSSDEEVVEHIVPMRKNEFTRFVGNRKDGKSLTRSLRKGTVKMLKKSMGINPKQKPVIQYSSNNRIKNTGIAEWKNEVAETNVEETVPQSQLASKDVVKKSSDGMVDTFDVEAAIASMQEYKELLKFTLASERSNHKRMASKISSPLAKKYFENEVGDFGLVELKGGRTIVKFAPKEMLSYNKYYDPKSNNFIRISDDLEDGQYLISAYCEKALEDDILNVVQEIDVERIRKVTEIGIVQAGPGCGKTYYITQNAVPAHANDADNILLSTKSGREDFVKRMESKHDHQFDKNELCRMRTLVSFLINVNKNKRSDKLYIDEALMSHPGSIMYAIILSESTKVKCLGDVLQIPFANRTPGFNVKYGELSKIVPIVETLYNTWRCSADVAFRLRKAYEVVNNKVGIKKGLIAKNNFGNTCKFVKLTNSNIPIKEGVKYLTFTQSDKLEVNRKLKNARLPENCETVHEFQGKEAKIIYVVRFDSNKQSELFLRPNYALVAISRHTRQLVYYTRVTTDALSKLIGVDGITVFDVATKSELEECTDNSVGYFEDEPLQMNTFAEISKANQSIKGNIEDILDNRVIIRYDSTRQDKLKVTQDFKTYTVYMRPGELLKLKVKGIINENFKGCKRIYVGNTVTQFEDDRIFSVSEKFDKDMNEYLEGIMNVNAMNCDPEYMFRQTVLHIEEPQTSYAESSNTASKSEINFIMDRLFAGTRFQDQQLDAWMVCNYDLEMSIDGVRFSRMPVNQRKRFDTLTPEIKTVVGWERVVSYRENLIAMDKRNKNVPLISGVVDVELTSDEMLEKFVDRCLDIKKVNRRPLKFTKYYFNDWISRQRTGIEKTIVSDFALHQRTLNRYNFSIKKQAKPVLTIDAVESYAALQTIVYHDKDINAIFCNIFNNIKARVMRSLRSNLVLFADMNNEEFESKLNRIVSNMKGKEALEIDISKYDKSQGNVALEFECKLMRYFGVEEYYIKLWYNAHILSVVYDKDTKIKAVVSYQRKSGDASTFIGNTLFLMAVTADLIDYRFVEFAAFSGDDSYIIGNGLEQYKNTQHFALKFNLDVKFYTFKYGYFCSRFLVHFENKFHFIPDPIKFLVKLGRHNMANFDHVNEYRISAKDNMKCLRRRQVLYILGLAIKERFGIEYNMEYLLGTIINLTKKEVFMEFYHAEKGAVLDRNKVFSIKNM
nr:hypothetical protein 1 [Cordoba virus]